MANFSINSIEANNVYQAETINIDSERKEKEFPNKQFYQLVGEFQFGEDDLKVLNKTGLSFMQVDSKEKFLFLINEEIIKKVKQLYLHFSGHSTVNRLIFTEELLTLEEIETLPQNCFEIVLLASCESYQIVESFKGIAKHCIGFLNVIETEEATKLTEIFWTQIQSKEFEEVIENLKRSSKLGKFIYAT